MPWIEDDREISGFRYVNVPRWDTIDTGDLDIPVIREPVAVTAGEQDHSNPWFYAGAPASAP